MGETKNTKLTILYASQTGNAQDVSERIWREAKTYNFTGPVQALDDYNIPDLINEKCVIFVCSTMGQGEEPDNMKTFWSFLLRKNLPTNSLSKVKCAVLGLGDSSYVKYNFVAKRLNKRLLQLGADMILPIALADDQHDLGYDAVVDIWIQSLWTKLIEIFNIQNDFQTHDNISIHITPRWKINVDTDHATLVENNSIYLGSDSLPIPKDAFHVIVKNNIKMTSESHFQDVRLIELSTNGQKYLPGDVLYVRPQNSKEQIVEFYAMLKINGVNIDPETIITLSEIDPYMPVPPALKSHITFQKLCEEYFDLTAVPRRNVFHILAQLSSSDLEKEKCIEFTTAEGQNDLYNYCNRPKRNITEVLGDFPHAVENITVDMLFEILSPIKPRAFSIASSFEAHKNEIHILVAVVKYKTKLIKERLGLCSNWLAGLNIGQEIPIWVKKGSFRIPKMQGASIIMVGPGTGVAPFRNYICEAEKLNKAEAKSLVLFFGCRNKEHDFLCKEDFKRIEKAGKLNLICAFSRDQDHKIYVQHKIKENSKAIWELLKNVNTYIFVAGNSKNMPDSVKDAFVHVCIEEGKQDKLTAENFINSFERSEKYQTETWS